MCADYESELKRILEATTGKSIEYLRGTPTDQIRADTEGEKGESFTLDASVLEDTPVGPVRVLGRPNIKYTH